jgi:hypothetical protein
MAAEVAMAQRAAHMAGMPTFPPQAAGTYNPAAWGSQGSVSLESIEEEIASQSNKASAHGELILTLPNYKMVHPSPSPLSL